MVAPVVALFIILIVAVAVIGVAWLSAGSRRHVSPMMAKMGRRAAAYLNGDAQVDWADRARSLRRLGHRVIVSQFASRIRRVRHHRSAV